MTNSNVLKLLRVADFRIEDLIAAELHRNGVTEADFAAMSFPLISDPVKINVQNSLRDYERGFLDATKAPKLEASR